ncbi:MAG: glycine hydroxymethyltransferase, partial [Treponema sp.]|nr:glycine hydroxymethyltransferase [Treponema sp.]
GMGEKDMAELGELIAMVIKGTKQAKDKKDPSKNSKAKYEIDEKVKSEVHARVKTLMEKHPVYPELDLELLKKHFCQN